MRRFAIATTLLVVLFVAACAGGRGTDPADSTSQPAAPGTAAPTTAFPVEPPAPTQPTCDDWHERDFFASASVELVRECLQAGADPHAPVGYAPAIHIAARTATDPGVISLLSGAGADPNVRLGTGGRTDGRPGYTPLHTAAERNPTPGIVDALVAAGADVNARDNEGRTPLHAAWTNHRAVVQALLRSGADPLARDQRGRVADPVSCANWNTDAFTRLALLSEFELCLGLGEDVNARDSVGKTPLHQAVEVENPSAVTFLLDAGAEINAGAGDNGTPLLHAISNRLRFAFGRLRGISEAAVNALLEAGADVNAPDSAGNTPLLASLSLYPRRPEGLATELAIRLLALGADPNGRDGQGRTPLYVAASVEGQEVVRALLEAGADSHALTDDGASTLHAAAESGSPEVIALLEFGADPEALDNAGQIADPVCHWGPGLTSVEAWGFLAESPAESVRGCLESGIPVDAPDEEGATLLARMVTMRGCCSDFDSVLSVFVGAGADVNARDDAGRTPLHRALGGGGPTSVLTVLTAALLDAGADPNARDLQGPTPLHTAVAALWESSSLVPLLAAGADLNARGGNNYLQGHSPLHYAGSNANPAVAAILLDAGADVNAPSPTGRTPLHEAAANASNPAVIELLAAAGANVNARDANGHTPLHSAAWNNHHPEIATALIAAGADVNARDPDGYDPSGRRANHRTPLLMAVFRGGAITVGQQWPTKFNAPVVEALVRAGADLTLTDESGRTALHEAARYHPAVFPLLLRLGADPNARDAEGNTPLDYALGNRSLEGLPEVRRMREALRNGRAGR